MNKKNSLHFSEDYVYMSYRYCIGRKSIAAHCHADTIANDVYNNLSDERMEFMARDIQGEIYSSLRNMDILNLGCIGNIPDEHFRPLCLLYRLFNEYQISSEADLRSINGFTAEYDKQGGCFSHEIHKTSDSFRVNSWRSLYDITSLTIWSRLASLLDKKNHKWCKLSDGSVCEYYEYWDECYSGDVKFRKIKCPVRDAHNFHITTYIPEEVIVEDNIKIEKNEHS